MQRATEAIGVAPSTPLNVSDMHYVYDIAHRDGQVTATILVDDIAWPVSKNMLGDVAVCPVKTGALVASVGGGLVEGWDMYGQYVQEVIGAAARSTIAFAGITQGPGDLLWVNQWGLPYKWLSGSMPGITIVAPADDKDARGTFFVIANVAEPTEIDLNYKADQTAPFGKPYATRFASGERVSDVTMLGTINEAGVIAITKTLIADGSRSQFYTMPDGQPITTPNAAGTVNYTIPSLWMSKYARTIIDVDTLVRGSTENGTSILVNLSGDVSADPVIAPAPPPDPGPLPGPVFPSLPASFSTHAQANEWLDEFTLALGIGEPLDWASQTLLQKHASAQALIDAIDAPT